MIGKLLLQVFDQDVSGRAVIALAAYTISTYTNAVFNWDETKRRTNLKDHWLDFADAEEVFEGVIYTYEDDRFDYGEQRLVTLGWLRGVIVSIAHTETEAEIRVISMRKASKREQKIYFENIQN